MSGCFHFSSKETPGRDLLGYMVILCQTFEELPSISHSSCTMSRSLSRDEGAGPPRDRCEVVAVDGTPDPHYISNLDLKWALCSFLGGRNQGAILPRLQIKG